MEKINLCYCHNCATVFKNENSQVDSEFFIKHREYPNLEFINDHEITGWVCPICMTDEYLIDLPLK
jgi:mRNA deadenylase 3'-5' endonuclease subunit Ccr4